MDLFWSLGLGITLLGAMGLGSVFAMYVDEQRKNNQGEETDDNQDL